MTISKFLKKKPIKRLIDSIVEDEKKLIFINFLNTEFETIKTNPKRIDCFCDILKNNNDNFIEKYNFYINSPSSYLAKEYRYGSEYVKKYKENLKNRPKIDRSKQNNYDPNYIANVHNVSIDEAKYMIEDSKNKLTEKLIERHKRYKIEGRNYRLYNPLCLEYWLKENNIKIAKEKHDEYIKSTRTNREGFSIRHGQENSEILFNSWVENRRNTWIKIHGTTVPMGARTSKESIKCFIPLYKNIRKMGFSRNDILWGIKGSKEFAHNSKEIGNVFYDFTIKSIKYIIEYNGSLWHSHPDFEYKGFLDVDKIIEKDYIKKKILEDKGYKIRYIWDFEDKNKRCAEILDEIEEIMLNG
jgi:very-short-patch-repair endonuclease